MQIWLNKNERRISVSIAFIQFGHNIMAPSVLHIINSTEHYNISIRNLFIIIIKYKDFIHFFKNYKTHVIKIIYILSFLKITLWFTQIFFFFCTQTLEKIYLLLHVTYLQYIYKISIYLYSWFNIYICYV